MALGRPLSRLRKELNEEVVLLLHERLVQADRASSTFRTRHLCATLCDCVVALRMPHLSRATGSHKLLPLLLRRLIVGALRQLPLRNFGKQAHLLLHMLRREGERNLS